VPGYEATDFYGLGVPRGTPSEIVERLNREVNAWLGDPSVKSRLDALGGKITGGSSVAAAEIIAADMKKWAEVVKFSGAKPE
jgi:tripartite-type tricarboxylate transporter receptor subunit TctC